MDALTDYVANNRAALAAANCREQARRSCRSCRPRRAGWQCWRHQCVRTVVLVLTKVLRVTGRGGQSVVCVRPVFPEHCRSRRVVPCRQGQGERKKQEPYGMETRELPEKDGLSPAKEDQHRQKPGRLVGTKVGSGMIYLRVPADRDRLPSSACPIRAHRCWVPF